MFHPVEESSNFLTKKNGQPISVRDSRFNNLTQRGQNLSLCYDKKVHPAHAR